MGTSLNAINYIGTDLIKQALDMHSILVPKELICGLVNHRTIHPLCKLSAESHGAESPHLTIFSLFPRSPGILRIPGLERNKQEQKKLHTLQRSGDVKVSCQTKVHPESQLLIQFNINLSSTVELLWWLRT